MLYEDLLQRFVRMSKTVLGENLIGVYLHGSLAMGCLNPEKSDLDLILVVENSPGFEEKRRFTEALLKLSADAPQKGFELSIVKRNVCKPFQYPTPFEFHYSDGHKDAVLSDLPSYIEKMQGTDKDLGAHFTIINHYGIALYGPPVAEVFAPVPKKDYIDSIWFDVQNAAADILEAPLYITLNLCRVLGYLKDGLVLSKKSGGEWGEQNVPEEYRALVKAAEMAYTSGNEMRADEQTALDFAAYMTAEIKAEILKDPENVSGPMLTDMGVCPTCYSRAHDNCFFSDAEETLLYKNELFECSLVDIPRAPGHTVIVSQAHYKDMMDLPESLCIEVFRFAQKAMRVIREVYGAESVYLCTMCDGPMNHFHVQLIPRYSYEKRGSLNFVKKRQRYIADQEKLKLLREKLKEI